MNKRKIKKAKKISLMKQTPNVTETIVKEPNSEITTKFAQQDANINSLKELVKKLSEKNTILYTQMEELKNKKTSEESKKDDETEEEKPLTNKQLRENSKSAAKRISERKDGLFRFKQKLKLLKVKSIQNITPFSSKQNIENSNTALYDELSYWNDVKDKYTHKIFTFKKIKDYKIKLANKNIVEIQKVIDENNKKLTELNKRKSIFSAVKDIAYNKVGLEQNEDVWKNTIIDRFITKSETKEDIKKTSEPKNDLNPDVDNNDDYQDKKEEVIDYLVKSGQPAVANFVGLEEESFKKVSDDTKTLSQEIKEIPEIKSLIALNSGILQRLDDIEKSIQPKQDTSVSGPEKTREVETTVVNNITEVKKEDEESFFSKLMKFFGSGLIDLFRTLKTFGKSGVNIIKGLFTSGIPMIADKLKLIAGDLITKPFEFIKSKIDGFVEMLKKIPMVGKFFEDGVKKEAEKTAGKTAAKTIGKSFLKKIPVLGAVAGAAFAVDKLSDGDIAGAGLELASGVVSMIPFVGTAASVAIDAFNESRDKNIIQKLKDEEVIDTNIIGDSEIKDWNKIEKLKPNQLKALIDYDDWNEEDSKKLQFMYENSVLSESLTQKTRKQDKKMSEDELYDEWKKTDSRISFEEWKQDNSKTSSDNLENVDKNVEDKINELKAKKKKYKELLGSTTEPDRYLKYVNKINDIDIEIKLLKEDGVSQTIDKKDSENVVNGSNITMDYNGKQVEITKEEADRLAKAETFQEANDIKESIMSSKRIGKNEDVKTKVDRLSKSEEINTALVNNTKQTYNAKNQQVVQTVQQPNININNNKNELDASILETFNF